MPKNINKTNKTNFLSDNRFLNLKVLTILVKFKTCSSQLVAKIYSKNEA